MKKYISILLIYAFVAASLLMIVGNASASNFTSASLQISDSRPSQASVTYAFGFTTTVTTSIKQLDIQICTTATGVCTAPGAFSSGTPTIGSDNIAGTGRTTTAPTANAFRIVVTTPAAQATQAVTLSFIGVTNPNSAATFYARITTYSDTGSTVIDGTTPIAFATTTGIAASVTVDPSLTFTVNAVSSAVSANGTNTTVTSTSSTIPFGSVTTSANGVAAHSLVVSTNAVTGYTVYARYTGALSDGNGHTIADFAGSNGTPVLFTAAGTSGFGYTTASTSLSGTAARFVSGAGKYAAFTTTNAEVARSTIAVSNDTTVIGYQVGIGGAQEAGTYTTTVTLTAVPTY